ncbi:MAG TPA: hypothetical protein VGH28_12240 [Polyangiaceae bacterium]|jgi:hypothetical protein
MRLAVGMIAAMLVACGADHSGFNDSDSGGGENDSGFATGKDGGLGPMIDGGSGGDSGGDAPAIIYAHTDTKLYSLDPLTQKVSDIGAFSAGSSTPVITDLAVDASGNVWVNSETAIYRAAVPTAPGPVQLTLVSQISGSSGQKFYALGFAPAGVLDATETLVAGDSAGALYAIATSGQTTDLGTFGTDGSGNAYELSGDVVFYEQNGTARGLATIRSCPKGSCSTTNDLLAEIDVAAMSAAYQSKTPGNLRKQLIGSGTGFGRLFGVGAWNSDVYAFSRSGSNQPAQLVRIDGTGAGTSIATFGQITSGWSGAGVTTKAPVTVLPPN